MHNQLVRSRSTVVLGAMLALLMALPTAATARPKPGYRPGFRLFAGVNTLFRGNKVDCRVLNEGQICSAAGSTQGGGGFWPTGTANQYIFNSGMQVAGIVDSASSVGTAGKIDGSFFFNASGGGNGKKVTDVWNSADQSDNANWPAIAYVPPDSTLYAQTLFGKKTASNNDIWFMSWEGDPSVNNARNHPLGIAVETRGLSYATPDRNDLLFFIYTLYNVTASDPHAYDAYQATRPELADTLRSLGVRFQALNEPDPEVGAIPDGGYTIKHAYVAFGADMDVTFENSAQNYAGVNVPFATGYTYQSGFLAPASWSFTDATIYGPGFVKGAGFIGVKYLRSPIVNGNEVGLTLFSGFSNGAEFSDPNSSQQLYRYLSGNLDPSKGDDACNTGTVAITKICYVNIGLPADMRFFQSSGPLDLAPGQSATIAVAYIFAAPVAVGLCVAPNSPAPCNQLRPNVPTGSMTRMAQSDSIGFGVNTVDSMTGYAGYLADFNNDHIVQQDEIRVVPGSLLGKALTAQSVFNTKFSAVESPKDPQFFLIPGDSKVTIIWKPSQSEADGDSYCDVAKGLGTLVGLPTGAAPVSYDPNFRCHDVEGYRIYRGTRGDAGNLQLLTQFDKGGTTFLDSTGQVNQITATGTTECDPPRGVYVSCAPIPADTNYGVHLIQGIEVPLAGVITQNISTISNPPVAYVTKADTAITGGLPDLRDTGVPLVFVDSTGSCQKCGVTTNKRYFYVVTAFDINSIRSGPASLESSKSGTKAIVPLPPPQTGVNLSQTTTLATPVVVGRNGPVPAGPVPTIDPVTGKFSGPFPPANGLSGSLQSFLAVSQFAQPGAGGVDMKLDSMQLGSAWDNIPNNYFLTVAGGGDTAKVSFPILQSQTEGVVSFSGVAGLQVQDSALTGKYGGQGYPIAVPIQFGQDGIYYAGNWGRGCTNGATGFTACDYNGARWFAGPSPANNETQANPMANQPPVFTTNLMADSLGTGKYNNGGLLPGIATISSQRAYQNAQNIWREMEGQMSGAMRAADFNVYWGTAGKVDSVIDITHDVAVPFEATAVHGASWGFLNQAAANNTLSFDARTELTSVDFGCVVPFNGFGTTAARIPCGGPAYALSDSAIPGPIAMWDGTTANSQTATTALGLGWGMYIAGQTFMFELPPAGALPAAGTVWSLRDYVGAINGGHGAAGDDGPYSFYEVVRPFNAVGATLRLGWNVNRPNTLQKVTLAQVHTIPDPYYVTSSYETSIDNKIIKFVNLPNKAIIRIYTVGGVLVRVLEHNSATSSEEIWDVRNRGGQFVASGVYFYHVEAGDARRIGRMTIINFAK